MTTQENGRATKRTDRRKRRSDQAIRRAFNELLDEKPLEKITVKELAERADIDRKTFYLRYDSIDDLVESRIQEEAEHIANTLNENILDENGEINVRKLFDTLGIELLLRLNSASGIIGHGDTDRIITKMLPALSEAVGKNDALRFSADLGPYFDLFAAYFCGGLLSLYNQWMQTESELPLETLAELASSAVTGGIVSVSATARKLNVGECQDR